MKNFKLIAMAVSAFLFVTASVSCGKSDEVITDSSPVAESTQAVTVASETTTAVTEQSTVATTAQTTTVLTTAQATTTTVQPVTEEGETAESDTDEEIISNEEGILIQDENNPYHFIIEGDFEIVDESSSSGTNQPSGDYVAPGNVENYDAEAYEKLGIKVVLSGSNAEQAQQYYDACVAAYPNLPWSYGDRQVAIRTSEVSSQFDSMLAGRDYHDLSIEELYSIIGYCEVAGRYDIIDYFNEQTSKDFTSGGWTAL